MNPHHDIDTEYFVMAFGKLLAYISMFVIVATGAGFGVWMWLL
jgi:hypothetical protein